MRRALPQKDQLDSLKEKGIPARTLNSAIPEAERKSVVLDLQSDRPTTKLLYGASCPTAPWPPCPPHSRRPAIAPRCGIIMSAVAPEGLASDSMKGLLHSLHKRRLLTRLVVDEVIMTAHCSMAVAGRVYICSRLLSVRNGAAMATIPGALHFSMGTRL
jgi:superfamily II DNA helicase RecQ